MQLGKHLYDGTFLEVKNDFLTLQTASSMLSDSKKTGRNHLFASAMGRSWRAVCNMVGAVNQSSLAVLGPWMLIYDTLLVGCILTKDEYPICNYHSNLNTHLVCIHCFVFPRCEFSWLLATMCIITVSWRRSEG